MAKTKSKTDARPTCFFCRRPVEWVEVVHIIRTPTGGKAVAHAEHPIPHRIPDEIKVDPKEPALPLQVLVNRGVWR